MLREHVNPQTKRFCHADCDFGVLALGLLAAGCGSNEEQRASTGTLTGAGVGAVVGGPIGAAVGAGVGAVGGAAAPEGADQVYTSALNKEKGATGTALNNAGLGPQASPQVQQAQAELQREGLYHGKVDGIMGQQTRQAVSAFQQREGLQQTAKLDRETVDRLNQVMARNGNANATEQSGTSTNPVDTAH